MNDDLIDAIAVDGCQAGLVPPEILPEANRSGSHAEQGMSINSLMLLIVLSAIVSVLIRDLVRFGFDPQFSQVYQVAIAVFLQMISIPTGIVFAMTGQNRWPVIVLTIMASALIGIVATGLILMADECQSNVIWGASLGACCMAIVAALAGRWKWKRWEGASDE